MKLTSSQKKAVEYVKGPLLIIAGAGTGKTTVLVEKINYLVSQKFAQPQEILALTFTEKAAQEMEERVDQKLPYGYFQMWMSTFHSFCDEVLRQSASHIGLAPNYQLQTQAQSLLYLKKNLFLFRLKYFRPLGNPNKFLEGLLQHFSRLRDEDISPKQYIEWTKNLKSQISNIKKTKEENRHESEKNRELAEAYKKFQELKLKDNVMDFGDLIFYTLELFRKRHNLFAHYREKFKYLLVDEFQDTNIAQYELIKLLAPLQKNPNLTLVGDDSQSIYKFRGAAVSNILQFMDEYAGAEKIVLLDNFRSHQRILDAAYRVIQHNNPDTLEIKLGISKNLKSLVAKGNQTSIQFHLSDRGEEEADFVAKEILTLHQQGRRWSDCALLLRANNHADPFARAFSRAGVPYQFLGPGSLYKQPEIKELIAYLKALTDIQHSPSLYRVLSMEIFNLDPLDLAQLVSFTKKTALSLFETVAVYLSFFYPELARPEYEQFKDYLFLVKQETKEKLFTLYQLINDSLSRVAKDTAGQILYDFLDRSSVLKQLAASKTEKEERRAINISRFFDQLKAFEASQEAADVFSVVEYLEMSMEFGESALLTKEDKEGSDAVTILTVHGAKGLEFPIVFLANLTADRFPTRERRESLPLPDVLIKEILPEGDYHLEEERRLFYVGLTRAKERVYLTAAQFYNEGKRIRKLSPFVIEAVGEQMVAQKREQQQVEKKQLTIFDFAPKTAASMPAARKSLTVFSFSHFETYRTCPLRYKYQYVVKIPVVKIPAGAFGETIHRVLQKWYTLFKTGQKPTLDTLLSLYKTSWVPIGYFSKRHEKEMKEEGEKMLHRFYQRHRREQTHILDLEKWFKTKVTDRITIVGKMDRVDRRQDGKLEIIDYKTGKKPDEKIIRHNLQLSLYALAAADRGLYHCPVSEIVLTLDFLQEDEAISLQKTGADLAKLKKEIAATAEEINASSFAPRPGPWCNSCPFKINCEAWQ